MPRIVLCVFASFIQSAALFAQNPSPDSFYKLGPDSLAQENVPHGKLAGPHTLPCEVFPGTQHTYWAYAPAQYDREKPCKLMIFNDGHAFMNPEGDVRATNVLDNLIQRRELPVMIAVFINPGRRPDQPEPNSREWGDRTTNRPLEYNALDDKYARVMIDELLPALKKEYNISDKPEDRGIGGASSGAIAAFTVAWERPDQFRKVLSLIGSYTNLRGGHVYPEKIRATERKPIRVFFQDGRNDNRGTGRGGSYKAERDWFLQNTRLVEAMTEKQYDINYVWGIGAHNQKHGGAIFPDMMRWLWRDHGYNADPQNQVERSLQVPVALSTTKPSEGKEIDGPPTGFDKPRDEIERGKLETVEYDSKTVGAKRNAQVYTPPGYSGDRKYPVLYLLHGIGGDEYEWTRGGAAHVILDNLYADKKLAPMIVVLPNGRASKELTARDPIPRQSPAFAAFENDLLTDLIPFVEKTYPVLSDRESRALAGLSMGGGQSLNFGLSHLDTFAWVGGFSSAPNTKKADVLVPDPSDAAKKLKLLWVSCGDKDRLMGISQGFHDTLEEKKVPHVWHVHSGGGHDFAVWKADLYHLAPRLFR